MLLFFQRIISIFLVLAMVVVDSTLVGAQTLAPSQPLPNLGRQADPLLKGVSNLPQATGGGTGGVFSEQVPGGLNYQIHVLGEVGRPGTYRVPASTRLLEVLQRAGGILDNGSERRIEIRRQGQNRKSVDLIAFTHSGNLEANPYLLDNDIVFVPLRKKVVQIGGPVRRPAVYEITGEKTLEDLIRLAGGFTVGMAAQAPIKVIRFEQGKKNLIEVEGSEDERKRFLLENGDVYIVPHFLTEKKRFDYNPPNLPGDSALFYPSFDGGKIYVIGAVMTPGAYPYNPYYDIRQYLTLAGGTTKLAKSRKVKILTAGGKTLRSAKGAELGPGDTIVVPEKYMAPEGILSLVLGVTTSILGITTTVLTLSR